MESFLACQLQKWSAFVLSETVTASSAIVAIKLLIHIWFV